MFERLVLNMFLVVLTLLVGCSRDVAGSTNEPNAVAELTDVEKIVLAKAMYTLMDSTSEESEEKVLLDSVVAIPVGKFEFENNYTTEDGRRICTVAEYSPAKSVIAWRIQDKDSVDEAGSVIYAGLVVVGKDTVVVKTMGSREDMNGYWGKDYSCEEYEDIFYRECFGVNGVVTNFLGGCVENHLLLGCAHFPPRGIGAMEYISLYEKQLVDFCEEDLGAENKR